MRKGFSLIMSLFLLALISIVVGSIAYLYQGKEKVYTDVKWTEKALNAARSGVYYAFEKIRNGEVSNSAFFTKTLDDSSEFTVKVTKIDDKKYLIDSKGFFKDAVKEIIVNAELKGGDYYPFMIGEKMKLKRWEKPFWMIWPIWNPDETQISVGQISDEDKEILESDGFQFIDRKVTPPSVSKVDKEEPLKPTIYVPDRSDCDKIVDGSLDLASEIISCLKNDTCGTEDDPYVICSKEGGSLNVKSAGILINSSGREINLVIRADKDLILKDKFSLGNGNLEDLSLTFIAEKGRLNLTRGIGIDSLSISGNVDLNFKGRIIEMGDIDLKSFNADGGINLNMYSTEDLFLKGSTRLRSFHASGPISFVSYSGKSTHIMGILDFRSFSAGENINLSLGSKENLDVKKPISLYSFSAGKELFVKLNSNKAIHFDEDGGIKIHSLSFGGKGLLDIEANEDIDIKNGIYFYSFNAGDMFTLNILSKNKSVKFNGVNSSFFDYTDPYTIDRLACGEGLLNICSTHMSSELNAFISAGKSIDIARSRNLLNLRSASFDKHINTILWADESIKANTEFYSFSLLSQDINFAVLSRKNFSWGFRSLSFSWPFFGYPFSGLTKEELEDLCNSPYLPSEAKKIPCSILSQIGSNPSRYVLTGWQLY